MDRKRIAALTALMLVGTAASPAIASDRVEQAHNAPQAVSGEFSLWAQGVLPTNTLSDGFECSDPPTDTEFCSGVFGFGGYAGVSVPVSDSWSLLGDLTIDTHWQTSEDRDADENPFYGGVGLHLVNDAGATKWGVFGLAAGGMNNEDDESVGTVFGGGGEVRWNNVFAQAGIVHYFPTDVSGDDTIETLYFGRVGGELDLGPGMLEASFAIGGGDFEESRDDNDPALWVQAAAEYEMPLTDYINAFVGYQGDFVRVDDSTGEVDPFDNSGINRSFFHTIRGGIVIPFGGEPLPFKTPNLRAPLTSAGEMN